MNNKLNVIFIGSFLYPYGYAATRRKQQFLEYIQYRKDYVRVLITLKRAKGHEINNNGGTYNGIPYEVIGANVKPNIVFPITFLLFLIKSIHKILKYRKRKIKNVIVAFSINFDTVFPLIFAKIVGYDIVFDIVEDFDTIDNELNFFKRIKFLIINLLTRLLVNHLASKISVVSYHLKNKYSQRRLPTPVLIPVSAENLNYNLTKTKHSEFNLLYSGTYGEKESIPTISKAFANLIKQHSDSRLILTGDCPLMVQELLMKDLGSLSKIVFTNRLPDDEYFQTLQNADVLLMTRNNSGFANAGFPYKLGEYLATGNPVISTKVSDINIYLKNMESVIMIEPENADSLTASILFIYNNRTVAEKIGAQGKEQCLKHFNPKINNAKFYALLQE